VKGGVAKRIATSVLDALLPQRCLCCGVIVDSAGAICPDCWKGLAFLAEPTCHQCGIPFPYEMPDGTVCAACTAHPPAFDRARAAFEYDDASRPLITQFKYGDQTDRAPAFGRMLLRVARPLLGVADLIAPVPLHRWRLIARRYNQAALLSSALARESGVPLVIDLMVRRRSTPPQVGMSARARQRNVAGAFSIGPADKAVVADKRVLLVDDVFTTGATVEECAKVLRRAGAAGIDVVTLARVIRPKSLSA